MDKEKIVEQYIKSGEIMYETTMNGNYRKGNREGKKLNKLFKKIAEDKELAKEIYYELFESKNPELLITVAAECLILEINEEKAIEILNNIMNNPEKYKIFSLNAEMTLKVWKEGKLKMY